MPDNLTPSVSATTTPEFTAAVKKSEEVATATVKNWPADLCVVGVCAVVGIIILLVAGWNGSVPLTVKHDIAVATLFGSLFLVSLFVERVIEIFVTAWTDGETAFHEQKLDYWQSRQGRLEQRVQRLITERDGVPTPSDGRKTEIDAELKLRHDEIEAACTCAEVEMQALLPFAARTQKISTWVGLIVGLFTAAVGFRFMAQIVDWTGLDTPAAAFKSTDQFKWFVAADVLLTGAVLAGGSKLVHRLFTVYESFMESSQKSLSDKSKTA